MPGEVDADGHRICPSCGMVDGPPRDLAFDLARGYLGVCRRGYGGSARDNTDDELEFAARLMQLPRPGF